ncbi:phosphotransferase enzyme family protein [Maribacter hydrothermalis]|uniref:Aminoglycoside phosphotransferase n=1 Tax=Maribacter hydrothermalis TaxID=1836467 RepID=A0A1B7Z4C1_9FLAO|nr:aminoglycoside phosphotransferase family protein [Maribacter hydrothermalis]APQ17279.1 aminoglycoside phosphotransferase [Maribacter hydrothermalis]OBR37538.1 aminoglycoside phosphotransferase [Maribacter hydrothermalis]
MTKEYIQKILAEFNLNLSSLHWVPLTSGLINDTYLITDSDCQQFILQKINTHVFNNAAKLMDNINYTLPFLNGNDYVQIAFLPTKEGKNCLQINGEFWRIMTYIANSTTFNTTTDTTIAFEAGRIVGKFHGLLKSINVDTIEDTLPKFHNLAHRTKEFKEALQNADTQKKEIAELAINQAHFFLTELAHLNNKELPVRICHNDTKLNNILFSKTTNKALCLIDLDTIMKGYFFYDFGDAIRTVVNNAPEDEQHHELINFDKTLFKAFVDGLAANEPFLTASDKESLPLGAVFMPFIHGLRALTDYLNNNKYYKVTYENQNLDRCLSLFNFSEKALNKKDFMSAYISQKLS